MHKLSLIRGGLNLIINSIRYEKHEGTYFLIKERSGKFLTFILAFFAAFQSVAKALNPEHSGCATEVNPASAGATVQAVPVYPHLTSIHASGSPTHYAALVRLLAWAPMGDNPDQDVQKKTRDTNLNPHR